MQIVRRAWRTGLSRRSWKRPERSSGRCPASDRGRHRGDIAGARFCAHFQARSITTLEICCKGKTFAAREAIDAGYSLLSPPPEWKRASQLPDQCFPPTWRACFFGSTRAVCLRTRDASSKRKRAVRFAYGRLRMVNRHSAFRFLTDSPRYFSLRPRRPNDS